ncbi:MAG TPA: MFS transporter [Ktedonobacterales bacterium]|jgi:MFS family permease
MTAAAGSLDASGHAGNGTLPKRSLGGLISISIFWFAINFHWAALQQIIIPAQVNGLLFEQAPGATSAERLAWTAANSPLVIALVAAPGLVIALIGNPLFGLLSDRTPGRFGRRRPYIFFGALANVLGLAVMAFVPNFFLHEHSGQTLSLSLLALMFGLMITQAANNAAAAPFHALLPDLVPQEQRGKASGIMGIALFLGQIGGFIAPALCGFDNGRLARGEQSYAAFSGGIALAYMLVAGVVVLMAILTVITVRERPWHPAQLTAERRAGDTRTWRDLVLTVLITGIVATTLLLALNAGVGPGLNTDSVAVVQVIAIVIAGIGAARAFDFSPRRNPDFSWVVLTRMLVMMGIYIVQYFMFNYMFYVVRAPEPVSATTIFFVLVTLTALLSTLVAGGASDRFGRKRMVYVSGAFMAVVGAAFVFAPYLVPGNLLLLAYGAATVFGLGYGAYVSVDWALVADVLPDENTYARDMGVWNIGLTLPQVIATVLGAWFIALGTALVSQQFGYTLLFVWFVIFCVLGTVTVRFIRGVK